MPPAGHFNVRFYFISLSQANIQHINRALEQVVHLFGHGYSVQIIVLRKHPISIKIHTIYTSYRRSHQQQFFRYYMFPREGYGMPIPATNNPAYSPYWFMHGGALQQLNSKIQKILDNEEKLLKEVEGLRYRIDKMEHHIKQFTRDNLSEHFNAQTELLKQELQEKSHFKKDKLCYVKGCNRRYSSRIALRAHMKKNHTPQQLQTDEFVP